MKTETIKNDIGLIIGYVEEDDYRISYRSLNYGVIAYYDKQLKLYIRVRQIAGKPAMSQYGDMGISDLRYWDGK
ncbi:MAG: hypothetical protein BWX72_00992 [Firmicutes bacterium ADurb.Bin080]|jgi:hypothetical protein|nr:MAG: hypothetical protein BWX72_00992 [Firmicutes bacterium ADurb.Bin080]